MKWTLSFDSLISQHRQMKENKKERKKETREEEKEERKKHTNSLAFAVFTCQSKSMCT